MILSILIVNWNTCELIDDSITSILAHLPEFEFEIIVVDNASTDGSASLIRRNFPQIHLIENHENIGFARAVNQALEESLGEYVLLLNSDTLIPPNQLSKAVMFLQEYQEAGAVGVKLLNLDGSFQASFARFPNLFSETIQAVGIGRLIYGPYYPSPRPVDDEKAQPVDWVAGAFLLVRREVYERVGGLDPDYWMYSEETDWCYRIQQAGWKIYYLPDVFIIHLGGGSSRQRKPESYAQLYRSKLLFFQKHYSPAQTSLLRGVFLLKFSLQAVIGSIFYLIPGKRQQAVTKLRSSSAVIRDCLRSGSL